MATHQQPHAVAELRSIRRAQSTRPFLARGHQVVRCSRCRLDERYCICRWQPIVQSEVAMCLLMYDSEPFKPSNTGWLIADIIPNTFAFSWTRTGDMADVKTLIDDPVWQPYLVFPKEYAVAERVTEEVITDKKPLFILLDGTWSEARKMFRKSPYLDHLPVLSLSPEQHSRYKLRRSHNTQHLCTAEVAALCLDLTNEKKAARALDTWLNLFTEHYLAARESKSINIDDVLHQQALAMKLK